MLSEKKQGWVGYWLDDPPPGLASITDLVSLVGQGGDIIKDDHRSLVKVIVSNDHRIIAKQPRDKNRRSWARVLTLVRDSEVKRSLRSLSVLRQKGVDTLRPIAAIEKRCWGMVTDSWLLYFFRDGRPCREEELHMVIDTLNAVHHAGFRHDDPHIRNFLHDGKKVFVIDCKGKPRLGKVSDHFEALSIKRELEREMEGESDILERLNIDTSSLSFRLALAYQRYRLARHRIKNVLRRKFLSRYGVNLEVNANQK
jgi:tRNA A-37 threonylcarbamoyl transferase component Bud32